MEVTIVQSTDKAEELVCRTARGDYTATDIYEPSGGVFRGDDDSDQYVKREEGEKTSFVEPPVPFTEVMDGVDGSDIVEKKQTLMKHLIRSGHYGPFEHPQITFAVKGVSRVTLAQITRHRQLTFDVQSMRYVDFSDGGDVVIPKSLRSDEHVTRDEGVVDIENREYWEEKYADEAENLMEIYESMVEDGVPKEDARFLLPLGTCVNFTMSGNARTFMHICNIRSKGNAQWEVREMTDKIVQNLKTWMPNAFEMYEEHGTKKLAP